MEQDNSMLNTETGSARASGFNKTQIGILVVVCVPLFFTVLNASAIGVLLPEIAADLNIGTGQVSWLMTGFLLVYGIAIPFYGRIADIYGAPRLFLIGLVVFAVGSVLSTVAPKLRATSGGSHHTGGWRSCDSRSGYGYRQQDIPC